MLLSKEEAGMWMLLICAAPGELRCWVVLPWVMPLGRASGLFGHGLCHRDKGLFFTKEDIGEENYVRNSGARRDVHKFCGDEEVQEKKRLKVLSAQDR